MSAIEVERTFIAGVEIVSPRKFGDHRGFFSETYNRRAFAEAGIDCEFVQDNHALSQTAGTIRGLHFQTPPFAQDKLVRVSAGSIYDVAVDLRHSSPTFGRYFGVELSAKNWRQLLVPIGCAHGYCSLEPNTEVVYKVTNYYSAISDRGLAWDDPQLKIDWPIATREVILSDKDRKLPLLRDLAPFFE
jgi:dTDP-4-dehydrorhamnose 3,5-epimerase